LKNILGNHILSKLLLNNLIIIAQVLLKKSKNTLQLERKAHLEDPLTTVFTELLANILIFVIIHYVKSLILSLVLNVILFVATTTWHPLCL